MDKRKEANLRVKKAITDSVFELMKKADLREISVTDIIKRAGVARVSFYRNYCSKEDVLIKLVRDVLDEFRDTADYDLSNVYTPEHIRRCLAYFKKYGSYIVNLHKCGYGAMILSELNAFHESIAGSMPFNSADRYRLYTFVGALYNSAVVWLTEERPAPLERVSDTIFSALSPDRA
ncbi:MAG: TetR/AcrR family transcriptional regulator [Clostridia bacterium]|nr:TetR/AcrR family transcriptional regulator [Clostridia bacterium]